MQGTKDELTIKRKNSRQQEKSGKRKIREKKKRVNAPELPLSHCCQLTGRQT